MNEPASPPGSQSFSTTVTLNPFRASSKAADRPVKPAPTIATSVIGNYAELKLLHLLKQTRSRPYGPAVAEQSQTALRALDTAAFAWLLYKYGQCILQQFPGLASANHQ